VESKDGTKRSCGSSRWIDGMTHNAVNEIQTLEKFKLSEKRCHNFLRQHKLSSTDSSMNTHAHVLMFVKCVYFHCRNLWNSELKKWKKQAPSIKHF